MKLKRVILLMMMFFTVWGILQARETADSSRLVLGVEDLQYHSAFEYKVFDEYEDGEYDPLSLLAAISPETDEPEVSRYRDRISDIVAGIGKGRFDRLSEQKKIKRIKTTVEKDLLVWYSENSSFESLFLFGNYDYISAAAIYAFIFDDLSIPYIIKESSGHIYLVAFPEKDRIIIETTVPGSSYYLFDYDTRRNFVEYLRDQGIIDEFTFKSTATRDLFDEYFFPPGDYGLKDLASLQYQHKAIEQIKNHEHRDAFFSLQKAYYLQPSIRVQYMLVSQLYTMLESLDFNSSADIAYLAMSTRYVPVGFDTGYILNSFLDITEDYLFEQNKTAGYERVYRYLVEKTGDPVLNNNLSLVFYYEMGRMYYNSGKFELALDHIERAFEYQPMKKELQILFVQALAGFFNARGSKSLIPRLEYYDEEFEIVENHDAYVMVKMHAFLDYAGESFQFGDAATGNLYLNRFEQLYRGNPDISIDHHLIGRSFSSAAIYYFRDGDLRRSEQLVRKGLELAPGNTELQMKLDSFRD